MVLPVCLRRPEWFTEDVLYSFRSTLFLLTNILGHVLLSCVAKLLDD